jgi:hypothetical protein
MTLCFHEKSSSPYPCWTSDPPYYLLFVMSFDFLPNSNPNALTFQVKNAEDRLLIKSSRLRSCGVCGGRRLSVVIAPSLLFITRWRQINAKKKGTMILGGSQYLISTKPRSVQREPGRRARKVTTYKKQT